MADQNNNLASSSLVEIERSLSKLGNLSNLFLKEALYAAQYLELDRASGKILYNKECIVDDINKITEAITNKQLTSSKLLSPRVQNTEENWFPDIKICLNNSLDSAKSHIINGLKTAEQSLVSDQPPDHWARTLLVLGTLALPGINVKELPSYIDRIIVVESNPRDLSLALLLSSIDDLIKSCQSRKIGIQFFLEKDVSALKEKLRQQLIIYQPTCLNGINIYKSAVENSSLDLVNSWLISPEGIDQAVVGSMGSEVDEASQLLQAIFTASQHNNRLMINCDEDNSKKPIVLVASGPSLDHSLEWLAKNQSKLQIVCAGSSLGSLLRNNITPSAAVFLERSSVVFENDICEILDEGYSLSGITLLASITLDPRIASCFNPVVWYHRPLSSALAFFHEEANSKLLQSGPESANAALEAIFHLGYKKILLIGCDFSAANRDYPRSICALGNSPRDMNIPVMGRANRTVFSSASLLESSVYFANAINVFRGDIYSVAAGVKFENVNCKIVDLDDDVAALFHNTSPLVSRLKLSNNFSSEVSRDWITNRIDEVREGFDQYIFEMSKNIECASEWSLDFARKLDSIFCLDEKSLNPSQAFIKRLCHYPFFVMTRGLYDSFPEDWEKNKKIAFQNISWLKSVYMLYFDLLNKVSKLPPKSNFDWGIIKTMIELRYVPKNKM